MCPFVIWIWLVHMNEHTCKNSTKASLQREVNVALCIASWLNLPWYFFWRKFQFSLEWFVHKVSSFPTSERTIFFACVYDYHMRKVQVCKTFKCLSPWPQEHGRNDCKPKPWLLYKKWLFFLHFYPGELSLWREQSCKHGGNVCLVNTELFNGKAKKGMRVTVKGPLVERRRTLEACDWFIWALPLKLQQN